jgi:hypothetical protein
MKKICKNCESRDEDLHCRFERADFRLPIAQDDNSCSDFFPPNPTCKECRWYCYSSTNQYCAVDAGYEPTTIGDKRLLQGCSRFQPNGRE